MHIQVRLDTGSLRHWNLTLLRRLATLPGVSVEARLTPGGDAPDRGVDALFKLEAVLHGRPGAGEASRITPLTLAPFRPESPAPADLVIDLAGEAASGPARSMTRSAGSGCVLSSGRIWTVTCNALEGDAGLLAASLSGETPFAEIREGGGRIAAGRLGTDYGGIALATYQDVTARLVTLIVAAVSNGGPCALPQDAAPSPSPRPPLTGRRLAALAARKIAGHALRQIYRLCYRTPHWRVGWRAVDGPDVFDLQAHPKGGWHSLPDDGKRFYADPFPILRNGVVTLFVEDFEHRLGKGIISAVAFDASGPKGVPVPVLELDCHLSYPFVFERHGETWMIPETCQNGTVELFRATAFPGGWVREAVLLDGVVASDVTIADYGGRWWMFATVKDGGGAFSDALHLWSAPDFRGPWTPHARNPVLIDIASARPAGRMIHRGGALLRPVQDCRAGYGAALGVARVTRLDDTGFDQTVEVTLAAGHLWPGRRLHSLNSAGGLEFIDGSGTAARWKTGSRSAGRSVRAAPGSEPSAAACVIPLSPLNETEPR